MSAMIDTLAFAERFESAGFQHAEARALASAFASANEAGRDDLVTKVHLDARFAEFETKVTRALSEMEVRLTKHIGDVGGNLSNRLWSTVAIIAGASTAISATIGAGVALILRSGM